MKAKCRMECGVCGAEIKKGEKYYVDRHTPAGSSPVCKECWELRKRWMQEV